MTNIDPWLRCLLLSALSLLIVVGCATAQPPEKPAAPSLARLQGSGRIVFVRTGNIFGFVMRADISLDQKVVGRSATATKFSVEVMPGMHDIWIPTSVYSKS
jgi:hypothetical protein